MVANSLLNLPGSPTTPSPESTGRNMMISWTPWPTQSLLKSTPLSPISQTTWRSIVSLALTTGETVPFDGEGSVLMPGTFPDAGLQPELPGMTPD